jgi:hypothetical protein
MTHAVIRISNCLYHCRYPLHRLLSRSQRDEGDADDNKYNGADEFSACDQVTECLYRHKRRGQSDHVVKAMRLRFADGSRAASSKKMPSVT